MRRRAFERHLPPDFFDVLDGGRRRGERVAASAISHRAQRSTPLRCRRAVQSMMPGPSVIARATPSFICLTTSGACACHRTTSAMTRSGARDR